MIQTVVGKGNFFKIIQSIYPEVAAQVHTILQPGSENDLSRIFYFYSRFHNIELKGYNEVNKRRVFIGVMMLLFHPYCLKNSIVYVPYGFSKNIAACFGCKQQGVTRNIREVVVLYKAYEEFGEKVNEVFEDFKKLNIAG